MKSFIIFDFDGTLTDAEQEGTPFRRGYLEDLSTLTRIPLEELDEHAKIFEKEVATHPERYGWLFQNQIVAPATVDPYLRMMPVARHLLDRHQALMNPQDRERVLDGLLYKYNYQKTLDIFRPYAQECLQTLIDQSTFIVTNSHTDAVQNKISLLEQNRTDGVSLTPYLSRVHGRAKKYIIDPEMVNVKPHLSLPGLNRPVLLRRHEYYKVLNQLRIQVGAEWEDLWVFGDIFELDLSLPLSLGARVGLVQNPFTPSWEIEYLTHHSRGYLIRDLREILDLVSNR